MITHDTFSHPVEDCKNCNYCRFTVHKRKRFKKAKNVCLRCGKLYGYKKTPSLPFKWGKCDLCLRYKPITPIESFGGLLHDLIAVD